VATQKRYLSFIDLTPFADAWVDLGLDDDQHAALEDEILEDPIRHPVVSGTGGLRKMRFVPPGWPSGKRGALRVCYVCFPEHGTIVLVAVYRKNVKDNLDPSEKRAIADAIRRLDKSLANFRRK
jgi:hypothetical protein